MKSIEIYDPAMCCSTGVCGPVVDPELIRMSAVVHNLKKIFVDGKVAEKQGYPTNEELEQ